MPFAPGVYDRSGEHLAAGLSQAFDSVTRGISGYRQEKRRKEDEQAAVDFLKKNGARFGLNVNDDKELKAAVKAAGGGPQAIQVFGAMEEMERRKANAAQQQQLAGLQISAAEEAARTRAGNRNAAAVAGSAPEDEAVAEYLRSGGDVAGAHQLADAISTMERIREARKGFKPELHDLGNGVTAMTTSRSSAVPVTKGTPGAAKPFSPAGKLLADADALEQAGRKDDAAMLRKIAGKQGADKPMTLTDYLISGGRAEDYRSYVESLKSDGEPAAASSSSSKAKGDDAGAAPVTIKTKEEFDKLKPGTRFTFNGRTGVKK